MKFKTFVVLFLICFVPLMAQDSLQTFLSIGSTGVGSFLREHPKYDGRGVILFVFDTGVDMGVEGLKTNSLGETKLIDVRDFTGEGDIRLYDADFSKEGQDYVFQNKERNYSVVSKGGLRLKASDDKYYIGCLQEKLWQNSNSGQEDINGNDSKNDRFYVLVFKVSLEGSEHWEALIDLNSNGDLSDETPIRNYSEKYDIFSIQKKDGLPAFTMALNVFPEEKTLSIYFDDGDHGTHVAGIASGFKIGSQSLNGVAPGARMICCKIGNNLYSGGATVALSMKKAFLYADRISRQRQEPCVINMSYGIGSELEGASDMESFIDSLMENNPYLYACISNGNDGPGISTTGLPAGSRHVLSSGAALPSEVGNDLYGTSLKNDIILYFSSRGGELQKPDVISPGAATSTVPNFAGADRMWGTSMASPYSAGVCALLLSAARQEFPEVKIPSGMLFKAIKEGAVKMPFYSGLDQGYGYINVLNSYSLLKKYIKDGEINKFEYYQVSSLAPNQPSGLGQGLYLRDGSFLSGNESFSFSIKREKKTSLSPFFRTYKLKSAADWLIPFQAKTYLRNNQTASVSVRLDKSKMSLPGLYTGIIRATRADGSNEPEFDLQASVVIPYKFNEANKYRNQWIGEELGPGLFKRYFLEVPAAASSLKLRLSGNSGKYINCNWRLFDPDGRAVDSAPALNEPDGEILKSYYSIKPGVYELLLTSGITAKGPSLYDLSAEFNAIRLEAKDLTKDENKFSLTQLFNRVLDLQASLSLSCYQREEVLKLSSRDPYLLPFKIMKSEASKEFEISLSKKDYSRMTDFAMVIYDDSGRAVSKGGLSYKDGTIRVSRQTDKDQESYSLGLIPGFATSVSDLKVSVKEITKLKTPKELSVLCNGKKKFSLYPQAETEMSVDLGNPGFDFPKDSRARGELTLRSAVTGKEELIIPLYFKYQEKSRNE